MTGQLLTLAAAFGLLARYVSPEVFWPPAIVALALPLLLLSTLLFLCFLLLRRSWAKLVFPALVLLASVPLVGHLWAWPGADLTIGASPTLTLVTNNQRAFRSADGSGVDSMMVRRMIAFFGADALLLQEILPTRYPQNFAPSILEAGKFDDYHQSGKTTIATYGNRLTPVSAHFAEHNEYNGFIISDMDTELGKIRLINAHLESNQISDMSERITEEGSLAERTETLGKMLRGYGRAAGVRARQATEIRRLVEGSPYPVILGGDFNDVPSSYIYKEMLSARLYDAWSARGSGLGTTFTGKLPGLRIDYFMVDTSLSVVNIERLASRWSDHRPLRMVVTKLEKPMQPLGK